MKNRNVIYLFLMSILTFSCGNKGQRDQDNAPDVAAVEEEMAAAAVEAVAEEQIVDAEVETPEPEEETYAWLSERLVTEDDLEGLDAEELRILRNAIYAVHGYKFKSPELQEYFSQFSWYEPLSRDVSSLLNSTEKKNVAFIQAHESSAGHSRSYSGSYSSSLASGDVSIDEYLRTYEEYVDKYISLMKRANKGDMTVLAEYQSMMSKADELANKIMRMKGTMSDSQLQRFLRIQQKVQEEAQKLSR